MFEVLGWMDRVVFQGVTTVARQVMAVRRNGEGVGRGRVAHFTLHLNLDLNPDPALNHDPSKEKYAKREYICKLGIILEHTDSGTLVQSGWAGMSRDE